MLVIYNVIGMNENSQHNNTLCVSAVEFLNCLLSEYPNLGVWCQCSIKNKMVYNLGDCFYLLKALHKGAVHCQGERQQLPSVRCSNKLSELVLLVQRCFIDLKNISLTRSSSTKWNQEDKRCAQTTFILSTRSQKWLLRICHLILLLWSCV